jgi:cyclophilin family peptidyl-prolyl cis-trans isomerase
MKKTVVLSAVSAFFFLIMMANLFAQNSTNDKVKMKTTETVVSLKTTMGEVKIKLYNETPLHRDNFIKLVKEKYYDGLLFHRVINNFMIQGGDPDSKNATAGQRLGMGGPDYTIAAEILPQFTHKKGAVAAARMGDQVNPKKESSGSQFYIVHNNNGTPHLDGAYTVFGEVIEGMDVIDKIATVKTDAADRPVEDVRIISASIEKH